MGGPTNGTASEGTDSSRGQLLVDREIAALLGSGVRSFGGGSPATPDQVQPASLDLRLGSAAWRVRAGFLPGPQSIGDRLADLALSRLALDGEGVVLERGCVYVAEIEEEPRCRGRSRAQPAQLDRVLRHLHARARGRPSALDEAPKGYKGRLFEISPLRSRSSCGAATACARRDSHGRSILAGRAARAHRENHPCSGRGQADRPAASVSREEGGSCSVGLAGRDPGAGARGRRPTRWSSRWRGAHDARDFFEPVHAEGGRCVPRRGLSRSRGGERLRVPPHLAAEMQPVGRDRRVPEQHALFDCGFVARGPRRKPQAGGRRRR
jgi:dCTP deaminase